VKKTIIGDCIDVLPTIREKIDLIITDPPYNIGWKYGEGFSDSIKEYDEWCRTWFLLCYDKLREAGVIAVINYPENNNVLYSYLKNSDFNFVQQIIWSYNTNIGHSSRKYTRSYRTILIYSKGKDYTFNPLKQPYKNPTDKRIKDRIKQGFVGTNLYDVWVINLCKNVSKSKRINGINQLPNELVDRLILSYSNEHDTILDPFVGTGTVIDRAEILGRNGIGIDVNQYKVKY
jgi:DNA modification methylase